MAYLRGLPSKGSLTFAPAEAEAVSPFVRADDYHLETPFYSITLDRTGALASIYDKEFGRELVKAGPGGQPPAAL